MSDNSAVEIGSAIAGLYGLSCSAAFMYFSWRFARENSFFDWLLLGFIIPMFQALVWPLYALGIL